MTRGENTHQMGDFRAVDVTTIRDHLSHYRVVPTTPRFDSLALEAISAEAQPDKLLSFAFIARLAVRHWLIALEAGERVTPSVLRTQTKERRLDKTVVTKDLGRDDEIVTLVDQLHDRLTERADVGELLANNRRFKTANRRLIIYLAVRRYAAYLDLKA